MSRVAVIVDGFNLYHSLQDAIEAGAPNSIKWLDIWALSRNFLPSFGPDAKVVSVDYCSSILKTRSVESESRHKAYIRALSSLGTTVNYGNFMQKPVTCRAECKKDYTVSVEKRTDVVVATKMLELLFTDACDVTVVISGDTDLVPAFEVANRLFKGTKKTAVAFPFNRHNYELQQLAKPRFNLTIEQYKKSILPNVITLPDGKTVIMPTTWK